LFVVTIFAMTAMGYEFGLTGARSWAVTILLVIVFTTVITLIADLDRPQQGLVRVSQQPLIDLLTKIGTPAP
jgi:ABC-type molybdate transport system ATPase subunit